MGVHLQLPLNALHWVRGAVEDHIEAGQEVIVRPFVLQRLRLLRQVGWVGVLWRIRAGLQLLVEHGLGSDGGPTREVAVRAAPRPPAPSTAARPQPTATCRAQAPMCTIGAGEVSRLAINASIT